MSEVQVKCINKQPRQNPHEGITHLGGDWGKSTRAQFITWLETPGNAAYVLGGGEKAYIRVVNGPNDKYVRTYRDNTPTDNLLSLRECA